MLACLLTLRCGYIHIEGYPERPGVGDETPIEVEIPRGATFHDVLARLVETGAVSKDDATMFKLFVLHRGAASRITAGKHLFTASMTPTERLEELMRRREATQVRVTIPEGRNVLQVAEILAAKGLSDQTRLLAAMRDTALLEELEIPGETIEGYLFPDTYQFTSDSLPPDILRRLVGVTGRCTPT